MRKNITEKIWVSTCNMLLKVLKSNRTVNFILIPVIGILLWLKSLITPKNFPFYQGETETILFSPVYRLIENFPMVQTLTALVLIVASALMLIQMNSNYNVMRERTMLPAAIFIIVTGGFTDLQFLHPVHFAVFILIFAIYRLFRAFDETAPYSPVFDAGFLTGTASLFYTGAIVIFPALLIGVIILLRETKWRVPVILSMGFLLPFIFAGSYAFVAGRFIESVNTLWLNIATTVTRLEFDFRELVYPAFLLFLIFLGTLKIFAQYDTKKISSRKFFMIFFLAFSSLIVGIVVIPAVSTEMFIIASVPLTFLLSNYFIYMKSRFWSELLFGILFALVIVMQIIS